MQKFNNTQEEESIVINSLINRLREINKPFEAERLLSLYNSMEHEDFDPENSDLLKLDSAKDFVTFLESVQLDGGPHFGMNDLGQIGSDWDITKDCYLSMDFQGNSKISGSVLIKDQTYPFDANLGDIKSKLSELKVI